MPDQLQLRGGTTVQHSTFTGASKEVTVDTTKKTVVVHDGSTAGGNPVMREDASNSALALGSAGTPSLKFTGDTNTGIYSPGADQVSVATGGTERLRIDSTGQIEAVSLGTAAAPVFSFTGDPDTGVYSPGANQVAISTNGQGRLFIGTTGAVGINNSSPSVLFHVTGTTGYVLAADGTTSGTTLGVFSDASYTKLIAVNNARSSFAPLVLDGSDTRFLVSGTERLRITSTGALNFVGAGTAGSTQAVSFNGSAPINSLVIDSSGRLGVGTSSPSTYGAQLAVIGGSVHADRNIGGAAAQVQFSMGASSGANFGQIGNTGTRWSLGYGTTANTIGTEVLVWNSSGNVGIGTSSVGDTLHVKGSSTYGGVIVDNSAATGGGAFRAYRNGVQKAIFCADSWVTGTSSDDAAIYADAGGGIKFYTNNSSTAKAVLTSGGSLGIGTTSPNSSLNVVADSGAVGLTIQNRAANDYGYLRFQNYAGTETQAYIGCERSGTSAGRLLFETAGSERMRIDTSGRLLVGTSTATAPAGEGLLEVAGLIRTAGISTIIESPTTTATTAVTMTYTLPSYKQALISFSSSQTASNVQAPGLYLVYRGGTGAQVATVAAHPSLTSVTCDGSTGAITFTPNTSSARYWTISVLRLN